MTYDQWAIIISMTGACVLLISLKGYHFHQTHVIITRAALTKLQTDVQLKTREIEYLNNQLKQAYTTISLYSSRIAETSRVSARIEAAKKALGKHFNNTHQLSFDFNVPTLSTVRHGPVSFMLDDNSEIEVYQVFYTDEKPLWDEGKILVKRKDSYEWIKPEQKQRRDREVQVYWFEDLLGNVV